MRKQRISILLMLGLIIFSLPAAYAKTIVDQDTNFTIGAQISPYVSTGYQIGFSFNETYLRLEKIQSGKLFGIRQTYFGNVSTNNSVFVFDFLIGNQSANISGNLLNITFKARKPTNGTETEILLTQWLMANENGNVDRSFVGPTVYDTVQINPVLGPPQEIEIPITYQGLMFLVSHFADPLFDQTRDGNTDIEDFIKISRQLS